MPETIGNHGLYCPDFDDYAAAALYMQDLGTKIDAALSAQQDELEDFLAAPTIIVTNAVAKTIPVGPGGAIFNVFDTVVFNNSTFMTYDFTADSLLIGSAYGITPVVPYRRGAYTAGAVCRMTATGAVTPGSLRALQIFAGDPAISASPGNLAGPFDSEQDLNTGGNEAVLVETNFNLTGTNGVSISHVASSDNAASTTSILAGSAFLWVTYNGPADIIEVA